MRRWEAEELHGRLHVTDLPDTGQSFDARTLLGVLPWSITLLLLLLHMCFLRARRETVRAPAGGQINT